MIAVISMTSNKLADPLLFNIFFILNIIAVPCCNLRSQSQKIFILSVKKNSQNDHLSASFARNSFNRFFRSLFHQLQT